VVAGAKVLWLQDARRRGPGRGQPHRWRLAELGIWGGAGGLLAIIAFWQSREFWLATVIVLSVIWAGAGVVHVNDLRRGSRHLDNLRGVAGVACY
jgi:hypothetical protein